MSAVFSRRTLFKLAAAAAASPALGLGIDEDKDFLRRMTLDVIAASQVAPGTNGPPGWPITNTVGFPLFTPGKGGYPAFWIRDFSMALDSGLIGLGEMLNHLRLLAGCQNGPDERRLKSGGIIPPYAIPDHINFDGSAVFYPGTYSSGEDQGGEPWGVLPPVNDHYEFVHIAYLASKLGGARRAGDEWPTLLEHVRHAFECPEIDQDTKLVHTTADRRAVGFGFCDGIYLTGSILFPSILRWRAAGELAELTGDKRYEHLREPIARHIEQTFADPGSGWLLAATDIGRQPDVWGTLLALHLGVLRGRVRQRAIETVSDAYARGTISYEGGVRHVPTDRDASPTSAWERTFEPKNVYQNGAYWNTPTGWLISALALGDRIKADHAFREYIAHLRTNDYRLGKPGLNAPWECFGKDGKARQNGGYLASVALPYGVFGVR